MAKKIIYTAAQEDSFSASEMEVKQSKYKTGMAEYERTVSIHFSGLKFVLHREDIGHFINDLYDISGIDKPQTK